MDKHCAAKSAKPSLKLKARKNMQDSDCSTLKGSWRRFLAKRLLKILNVRREMKPEEKHKKKSVCHMHLNDKYNLKVTFKCVSAKQDSARFMDCTCEGADVCTGYKETFNLFVLRWQRQPIAPWKQQTRTSHPALWQEFNRGQSTSRLYDGQFNRNIFNSTHKPSHSHC